MRFVAEPPTEAGWYWMRWPGESPRCVEWSERAAYKDHLEWGDRIEVPGPEPEVKDPELLVEVIALRLAGSALRLGVKRLRAAMGDRSRDIHLPEHAEWFAAATDAQWEWDELIRHLEAGK